jgi:hypothetical protein
MGVESAGVCKEQGETQGECLSAHVPKSAAGARRRTLSNTQL